MFDFPDTQGRSWKSYFDYIFVDSQKPKFFQEGTTLREVDEETGTLKLGQISIKQGLEKMKVYAGGSSALLCQYVGMSGKVRSLNTSHATGCTAIYCMSCLLVEYTVSCLIVEYTVCRV